MPPTTRLLPRPCPIQIVPSRPRRPQTASARVRMTQEVGELGDEIENFETRRGLSKEGLPEWDDDPAPLRKSWAERKDQVEHEMRMEELAERFKSGAQKPTRGTQYDIEPFCRRPISVRPQSAPSRPLGGGTAAQTSQRSSLLLQYWLGQHRAVIEQHTMTAQHAGLENIRLHEERMQARRQ